MTSEARRRWREANPEKVAMYHETWRRANLDKAAAASRRWRADNPDKVATWNRHWREANADKRREDNRRWAAAKRVQDRDAARAAANDWRARNPDKVVEYNHRQRAARKVVPSDLTAEQWQAVAIEMGERCVYCGDLMEHMDHDIPLSRGGFNTRSNVVPACAFCNVSKNARTGAEFVLARLDREGRLMNLTVGCGT